MDEARADPHDADDAYVDDDAQLRSYVRGLGATDAEMEQASGSRPGGLGPLALDLSIRPPGECQSLEEFLSSDPSRRPLVERLWRAVGLPEDPDFPFPVTADLRSAMSVLVAFAEIAGEELVVGFARVLGESVARMAEAVSGTTRIGAEVPMRESGVPYSELVREYTRVAREGLPELLDVVTTLFRRHVVVVSYQRWSADDTGAVVTLQRTVGFADLVSSTQTLLPLSVADIARAVRRFEQDVWDVVAGAGGRVVKLIGDEAMFVHSDPVAACRIAGELVTTSSLPIRVGLARGDVVSLHGDYYGPTVNLAARLVAVAPPSGVVVSQSVAAHGGGLRFEPIETGPLKGFSDPGRVFQLVPGKVLDTQM